MDIVDFLENWNTQLKDTAKHAIKMLDMLILPEKPIIIFDIDDTLIDSLGNPIIPICTIYHYAILHDINIGIVTARADVPENNEFIKTLLRNIGIVDVKEWYFRPINDHRYALCKEYARGHIERLGYNIIMSIGDRDWDIYGLYTGMGIKVPSISSMMRPARELSFEILSEEKIENNIFENLFTTISV